jgi:hypothetical protein
MAWETSHDSERVDYRAWGGYPTADNLLSSLNQRGVRGVQCQLPIKLLDAVALTFDLPEYNLWRGQVGTVVEILADGGAFEVEFSDREGRTYESLGLWPDQIMVLHYEPLTAPPSSASEPAQGEVTST